MSSRTSRRSSVRPALITAAAGLVLAGVSSALPVALAAQSAPARAESPALSQSARIALGTTTSIFKNAFTEAPNGTVFYSKGSVVYAVVGNTAPAVAEHAGAQVLALAANASDLFVQTGLTVTEYSRSSGAPVRHWTLTSPVTPINAAGLIAVGSTLWSWTDWATDESGFEFAKLSRITTSSATVHSVDKQAFPGDWAANSSGLYYQDAQGPDNTSNLVHVTPGGTRHQKAQASLDAPAALAGGRLVLLSFHNGHQNVDSYSTSSLTRISSAHVNADDRNIAGTSLGLVVLDEPCSQIVCSTATVSDLAFNGSTTGALTVPDAFELLAGPSAAVIEVVSGHMFLVRIGS